MKTIIVIASLFLISCSNETSIIIDDLRIGKAIQGIDSYKLYDYGSYLNYEENHTCNVKGKNIGCLLHGFEFRYSSKEADPTLKCKVYINRPVETINKEEGTTNSNTYVFDHSIQLYGNEGQKVSTFKFYRQESRRTGLTAMTYECFHNKAFIFKTKIEINLP